MSDSPESPLTPTTPSPLRVLKSRPREEEDLDVFGGSPSKKGSIKVKYGGKRRFGGAGDLNSSPIRGRGRGGVSTRDGDPDGDSDNMEVSASSSVSKSKKKGAAGGKKNTKKTTTSSKRTNLKRKADDDDEEERNGFETDMSDLTPPPPSPAKQKQKPTRKQQAKPSSVISISSGSASPMPRAATQKGKGKGKSTKSKVLAKADQPSGAWSLETLGEYVLVVLNIDGSGHVRLYQEDGLGDDEQQWYWWPAKKTTTEDTLNITPYFPDRDETETQLELSLPIAQATSANIIPLGSNSKVKFDDLTPAFTNTLSAVKRSPKKKRKTERHLTVKNLEDRYHAALGKAIHDKYDGLPPVTVALSRAGSFSVANGASSKAKAKASGASQLKKSISDDELTDLDDANGDEDEGLDTFLDIPGQPILCRDKASSNSEYWPAKILEYVPPKKKKKGAEGKYKVKYLDETEKAVPRSWFYASYEDDFGSCRIGEFQSEFVDNPNDDDDNLKETYADYDFESEFDSLLHNIPEDSTSEYDISELILPAQFVHVIPILQAALNNAYLPAKDPHAAFVKGGKARDTVKADDKSSLRGKMNPQHVKLFGKLVQGWCLGKDLPKVKEDENADEETKETEDTTGDTIMALDEPNNDDNDTAMDVQDDPPYKENTSPNNVPPANDVGAKPVGTDGPSPPESSILSFTSAATTPLPVDEEGEAPLPPINTTATTAPVLEEEESALTPVTATPYLVPPARARKERESQKGCEPYEALSGVEKVSYIMTILHPIVIRQILLWRNGHRSLAQLQPLPDDEELELAKKGEELVRETDWVFDVRRLRDAAEKKIAKQEKGKGKDDQVLYSASGRKRESVSKAK